MDKELVVIVPNETVAYEVVRALKALDDEGSIELYASTVVTKAKTGLEVIENGRHLRAPFGTVLGLSTGALIGLLGGPIGVAVGAAVGATAGLGGDLAYSGFAGDFVRDVAARLPEGGYAVVASVWEDWTTPVDVAMAPYGGVVFRQATDDVVIAQIRAEMQQIKEDEAQLQAEIARSSGETKAKLEARRSELRAKYAAQRDRLHARANKLEESWHAKVESIKERAAASKTEAKARHQQHVEKLSKFATTQKQAFRELFS